MSIKNQKYSIDHNYLLNDSSCSILVISHLYNSRMMNKNLIYNLVVSRICNIIYSPLPRSILSHKFFLFLFKLIIKLDKIHDE